PRWSLGVSRRVIRVESNMAKCATEPNEIGRLHFARIPEILSSRFFRVCRPFLFVELWIWIVEKPHSHNSARPPKVLIVEICLRVVAIGILLRILRFARVIVFGVAVPFI